MVLPTLFVRDVLVDPVDEEAVSGQRLGPLGGQQRRRRGVIGLEYEIVSINSP